MLSLAHHVSHLIVNSPRRLISQHLLLPDLLDGLMNNLEYVTIIKDYILFGFLQSQV